MKYLNKKHGISTLVAFLSTNSWMLHLTNLSGDNPGDIMVFSVGFMGGLKLYHWMFAIRRPQERSHAPKYQTSQEVALEMVIGWSLVNM